MTISYETKSSDLRERMGTDATDSQAREMLDILIAEGWRGQDTADIPEPAWLSMLDQALTAAPVLTCYGSVRGCCGHRHETVEDAQRCLEQDAEDCGSQGGYSDRCAYRIADLRQCQGRDEWYIPAGMRSPEVIVGRGGQEAE